MCTHIIRNIRIKEQLRNDIKKIPTLTKKGFLFMLMCLVVNSNTVLLKFKEPYISFSFVTLQYAPVFCSKTNFFISFFFCPFLPKLFVY